MDNALYVAVSPTRTSAPIALGATSMTVAAIKDRLGNALTMADFGSKGYGVISPGKDKEEQFVFTGISGTSVTGISWVTMKAPYTETSGFAEAHAAGERVVLYTNSPAFYNSFVNKNNDETIAGIHTFTASPIVPTPTTATQVASKGYVDGVAFGVGVVADESTAGYVEEATQAEVNAGTATGSTGAKLFVTPPKLAAMLQAGVTLYAVEDGTGADDTYTVAFTPALTAYTEGQMLAVKFTVANTGAATLNANSLGAKAIKKYVTGAKADIETGDIVANFTGLMEYDGTDFVLISMSATIPTTALLSEMATFFGATDITGAEAEAVSGGPTSDASQVHWHPFTYKKLTYNMATASGTSTVAHGIGRAPRAVKITAYSAISASVKSWSIGSFDGTVTQSNTIDLAHSTTETSTSYIAKVGRLDTANHQTATIAVDATNITLTWTKTGTPTGNAELFIESFA